MSPGVVTVFGGTGFLGRRVVRRLLKKGWSVRVAARHAVDDLPSGARFVQADISDFDSLFPAVEGANGVLNAVSLYVEHGPLTFQSIHVDAAAGLARCARRAGVRHMLQMSGIGADPGSPSSYIRSRGRGEYAVRAEFPQAVIIRPAVMFGRGDRLVAPLVPLVRRLPVFPLFGQGRTRLQPAYVGDVADGIARILTRPPATGRYEFGGPDIFTYRSLVELIAAHAGRHPVLLPWPFGLWRAMAGMAERLPRPPITRNQVELMEVDNVPEPGTPGFATLGLTPTSLEEKLPQLVRINS